MKFSAKCMYLGLHVALAMTSSCMHLGEARTERDAAIGIAEQGALRVQVAEGAAVVRALAPGRLQLWANAPTLRIELDPGEHTGDWEIQIDNAMPDAELRGEQAARLLESPLPTTRRFRVPIAGARTLYVISPDFDDLAPWKFLFFADVQEAIDRVQDLYAAMNLEVGPRFALIGGDLTSSGTDAQLERFEHELRSLEVPAFATVGNHELFAEDGIGFQQRFGRASSHFEYRGVAFSLIDSASSTVDPAVYARFDEWLTRARERVHIVSMHIPPLDPIGSRAGGFASKHEAQKILQRMADGKVDLTLYGHIHSYYAFANAGIPAFIAGGGGAIPESFDGIGRHYLIVDVDPIAQRLSTTLRRVD